MNNLTVMEYLVDISDPDIIAALEALNLKQDDLKVK